MTDLLLHNARLLDPARGIDEAGYVAVTDGVIAHAGPAGLASFSHWRGSWTRCCSALS